MVAAHKRPIDRKRANVVMRLFPKGQMPDSVRRIGFGAGIARLDIEVVVALQPVDIAEAETPHKVARRRTVLRP